MSTAQCTQLKAAEILLYLPESHNKQFSACTPLYFPATQGVQLVAAEPELYFPASQGVHLLCAKYFPAGHSPMFVQVAAPASENVLLLQKSQSTDAAVSAYLPDSQFAQALSGLFLLYFPGSHESHVNEPTTMV